MLTLQGLVSLRRMSRYLLSEDMIAQGTQPASVTGQLSTQTPDIITAQATNGTYIIVKSFNNDNGLHNFSKAVCWFSVDVQLLLWLYQNKEYQIPSVVPEHVMYRWRYLLHVRKCVLGAVRFIFCGLCLFRFCYLLQ